MLLGQIGQQRRFSAAKVFKVPIKDAGQYEFALGVKGNSPRMRQKCSLGLAELQRCIFFGVCLCAEIRTTNTCAVQHVVQSLVLPDGSEDAMFDIVQGHRQTLKGQLTLIPRTDAKNFAFMSVMLSLFGCCNTIAR